MDPSRAGSIRARITAIAGIVAAAVLIGTAVGTLLVQRAQLSANLDDSLEQRADQLSDAVEGADDPARALGTRADEDRAVQLVGADGVVIAASGNLTGAAPVADFPRSAQSFSTTEQLPVEDDAYRILSRRVDLTDGEAVLHVAQNIDDLRDAVRGLAIGLVVSTMLAIGAITALVWWLVGRTLQPVEDIRREVASVTGTDLERRVPVPSHDDEIARLARTMNDMLDRLAAAGEGQRQFVADASHELRSPLTRIRAQLEVDAAHPENADLDATHALVLAETAALQRLVEDLLQLARLDADPAPSARQVVELDDVVLRAVEGVDSTEGVDVDLARLTAVEIEGNHEQLVRLVRNLVENAVGYAESTVTIETTEHRDSVELAVCDDGPGIPADARDRIFERFGRSDDSRTQRRGGAGLGLAIGRAIAVRHGGSLDLDPDWRDGSRFVVQLPRGDPEGYAGTSSVQAP